MNYHFASVKTKNAIFFLFYDVYQKTIYVSFDKKIVFSQTFSHYRQKNEIEFTYLDNKYRILLNTRYYYFKKIKSTIFENDIFLASSQAVVQKHWLIKNKPSDYQVDVLYNTKTSSIQVKINSTIIFDTLKKIKAFEPKNRELFFEQNTFILKKDKVDEIDTLSLKFNHRNPVLCQEDEMLKNYLDKFKKNQQHLSLRKYLQTKYLEIFTLPLFLNLLFIIQTYLIQGAKLTFTFNTILFFVGLYFIFTFLVSLFYMIGYKNFKKRFKF